MTHIMTDTETLGRRPGCIVLSIGGVVFDPITGLGEEFYRNIDPTSCEMLGLTAEPETLEWWKGQSEEARAALEADQVTLTDALMEFADFYRRNDGSRLWAHGPNFDEVILVAAYEAAGVPVPWSYKAPRCTRTLYENADVDPKAAAYQVGTLHNALDDAKSQALAAIDAMLALRLANVGLRRSDPAGDVNALVELLHGASVRAGWWHENGVHLLEGPAAKMVVGTKLCLVHSEVSEAMEGHRKGLNDDKLPHRPMAEVELADAVIRICDLAGALGFDLGGAIVEKAAFNAIRPDHKPEARAAAGGKAY